MIILPHETIKRAYREVKDRSVDVCAINVFMRTYQNGRMFLGILVIFSCVSKTKTKNILLSSMTNKIAKPCGRATFVKEYNQKDDILAFPPSFSDFRSLHGYILTSISSNILYSKCLYLKYPTHFTVVLRSHGSIAKRKERSD